MTLHAVSNKISSIYMFFSRLIFTLSQGTFGVKFRNALLMPTRSKSARAKSCAKTSNKNQHDKVFHFNSFFY